MQLTLHTDIGLRVLIYMGGQSNDIKSTVAGLAELFNVSKNHMVKIVNELGKAGYLKTVRGKGGGIYLAKKPQDINIAAVVKNLEKITEVVDCKKNNCPFLGNCKLKLLLNQATEAFFEHLEQCSLVDVMADQATLDRLQIK